MLRLTVAAFSTSSHRLTRHLKNHDITYPLLQLVNPRHTSSSPPHTPRLIPPASTSDILARIDTATTTLVVVDHDASPPIAKLIATTTTTTTTKPTSSNKVTPPTRVVHAMGSAKEVTLSWATTENDTVHKLKIAKRAMQDRGVTKITLTTPPGRLGESSKKKSVDSKKQMYESIKLQMQESNGTLIKEEFEGKQVTKVTMHWKLQ